MSLRFINNTLITIKNSLLSKRGSCSIDLLQKHSSKFNIRLTKCFKILNLLYLEGFILSYFYDKHLNRITVYNNYYKNKPVINILKIFNKSSFPVYLKYTDLMTIHKFGIDLLILSTNKGLKPHYLCIKQKLGGRLICYIK
jgi:ribosomal protein S8